MRSSRRFFVVFGTILVSLSAVWLDRPLDAHAAVADRPATTAQSFLALDGAPVGWLTQESRVQTAAGIDETLVFQPGAMSSAFYSGWVSPMMAGRPVPKTMAIAGVDFNYAITSVDQIASASPRSILFPALDGSVNTPVAFTIVVSAPSIKSAPKSAVTGSPAPATRSVWPGAFFRLSIDGIETSRTISIGAITVTAQPTSTRTGGPATKSTQTTVTVTPLVVKLPDTWAAPFQQWLAGSASTTKSGSIQYLKTDASIAGTLALSRLGITRVTSSSGYSIVEMTIGGASFTMP